MGPPLALGARPLVLVEGDLQAVFNKMNVTAHYAPNAHTDSDVFLVFKKANNIGAADLVFGDGGAIDGRIAGRERVLARSTPKPASRRAARR